jgi:uncharacterized protein with HEPN domain
MAPYDQFKLNIQRVENLLGIYRSLSGALTSVIDISDILRSEIVLLISALDYYVHSKVLSKIEDAFTGKIAATSKFQSTTVRLATVKSALGSGESIQWLLDEVHHQHSWKSFQTPDNIADALKMVSDKKVWEVVAKALNMPQQDIKDRLRVLVERRNKIAHEADSDPSLPTAKLPITDMDVESAIKLITSIVDEIEKII